MTVDKQLLELTSKVASIDTKLDTLLEYLPIKLKDHEDRITSMERKWNIVTGIGLAFSLVGSVLTYMYNWFHIFPNKG